MNARDFTRLALVAQKLEAGALELSTILVAESVSRGGKVEPEHRGLMELLGEILPEPAPMAEEPRARGFTQQKY